MADVRPDLGALLDALSPYLEHLEIQSERVAITVSPPMGRSSVTFARLVAPGEDLVAVAADAALEAARWLNDQPSVRRKVPTDTSRPALDLASSLAALVGAVDAFAGGRLVEGCALQTAVAGAREALRRWGGW